MLFPLDEHAIYRAQQLLARAVGGIEALPPNLLRMDSVAEIFSAHLRLGNQSDASAASSVSAPAAAPASTRSQDGPQPRAIFQAPSAVCRDFDPFITSDLGEWMARIRHVLSIALGHPDCTDEDMEEVADIWRDDVCHEVKEIVEFIRQNKELLVAAWEAGKPYLGPDTKAGRERMRKEHQAIMIPGLAEENPRETVNPPRETDASASSSSSSTAAAAASFLATPGDAQSKSCDAFADMRNARQALREQNRPIWERLDQFKYDSSLPLDCDFPRRSNITDHHCIRQHGHTSAPTARVATEALQRMRHPQLEQNSAAPGSVSPGHKEQSVEATRTVLGSLSLSKQNRRNNKTPAPEGVGQPQQQHYHHPPQYEDEGYDVSDMGYPSPKDDGEDPDHDHNQCHNHDHGHYEQGQDLLQDHYRYAFEQEQ
ncbi:hypothetical protein QBC32DRAFT_392611 [Pseudoneurospora amorphoporcata]|uniref:Uncharacterized protein n=1 Tax=Pseudoneurospora amorphoporcata TaxID=241081 RepID=A0AAN6P202_9PEZI|nr:hypothetical protein QBC32DRAFT_392611 [Pseudoneurospora amorphoporcata]